MNFEQARIDMIEQQIRTWDVYDHQVLKHVRDLPREIFIPKDYKEFSYADMQIPLAHEQVMLPPREVARILQNLQPKPHEKVLEIGTGSGYLTALFAKMAAEVSSVDIFADIAENAQKAWHRVQIKNIQGFVGDALKEWEPAENSLDIICITGSMPEMNEHWNRKLSIGGRLFVVLGELPVMRAYVITRMNHQDWKTQFIYETFVPPLIHAEKQKQFEF